MICISEPWYFVGMLAFFVLIALVAMTPVGLGVYMAAKPPRPLTPEERARREEAYRQMPGYSPGVLGSFVWIVRGILGRRG